MRARSEIRLRADEKFALALMERLQATRHKLLVFAQRASGEDAQIC